jgi:vacuolar-type H+-ATPase catalytic subunit A/Vma1
MKGKEKSAVKRTLFEANKSNMDVVAKEAGVCAKVTIKHYFGEVEFEVNVMAKSASRLAVAFEKLPGPLTEEVIIVVAEKC